MQEVLLFLEQNPQLITLAELVGKICLCVLGIIIYRRTGKVLNINSKQGQNTVVNSSTFNPADGLTVEELEEFAVCLSATVDKIHELKERKK